MSRGGSSLGTSGTGFPTYMTDTHEEWLGRGAPAEVIDFNIVELMNAAFAASTPFEQFDYVDPEDWLEDIEEAISDVTTELSALDPETDWGSNMTKALTEVATLIDTDYATVATAMATAWENLTAKAKTELALIVTDGHIATIVAYFSTWSDLLDAAITKAGTAITDTFAGTSIAGIADWTTIIDAAKVKADSLFSDSEVDGKVDAYEDDVLPSYQREVARFSGGMADINAVNSSAFMVGLALLARRRVQDVNKFRADLKVEYEKEKLAFINNTATLRSELERGKANIYGNLLGLHARISKEFMESTSELAGDLEFKKADTHRRLEDAHADREVTFITKSLVSMVEMLLNQTKLRVMATNSGIGEMMKYQLTTVDMNRALASLVTEFNRLKIVASQEYLDRTLDLDIKNALWDVNVYQYGTNVLSGIGAGGQIMPEKMSAAQSALGGALSGAAIGIQSGNPAGVAIGALVGGIGGYLAGG